MIERWTPKIKKSLTTEGMELRMWTDKDGEYVLYKDYQQLESQLAAAKEGLDELKRILSKGDTPREQAASYQVELMLKEIGGGDR